MNLKDMMNGIKDVKNLTANLKNIPGAIKSWAKKAVITFIAPAIPWVVLILLAIFGILGIGEMIKEGWDNFWNGVKGVFGTRYTISSEQVDDLIKKMGPALAEYGYDEEELKKKEDDIKYYFAAQVNSFKPFDKPEVLDHTITYSLSGDIEDGETAPANVTEKKSFDKRPKIEPYVLHADFYLALDVSTQNKDFARDCGETSNNGGFEMTKDDATFMPIYNEVKTVTTIKWQKAVYRTETVAPPPTSTNWNNRGSNIVSHGYSTIASINYLPIYGLSNTKLAVRTRETDPGETDPGTTDPGTTDPGTTDPGTNPPATQTVQVFDHYEPKVKVITKVEKVPDLVLTKVRSWATVYTWEYGKGPERHEVVSDDGTTKVETFSTSYELTGSASEPDPARFIQLSQQYNIDPTTFEITKTILIGNPQNAYILEELEYAQSILSGEIPSYSGGSSIDIIDIPLTPGDGAAADAELKRYPLPQLYQHDKRWGGLMYSIINSTSQTIASSGCGPSSAAIVLSGMTGSIILPPQTCKFSLEHGYRTTDNGTSWGFFGAIAKTYGINVRNITLSVAEKNNFIVNGVESDNIKAIKQALANQDPMVVSQGPGYWTSGGHFHVWGGSDSAGKVIIVDPNKRSGHYDLTAAIEAAHGVFIFTK